MLTYPFPCAPLFRASIMALWKAGMSLASRLFMTKSLKHFDLIARLARFLGVFLNNLSSIILHVLDRI
jgi:hypothetical protein